MAAREGRPSSSVRILSRMVCRDRPYLAISPDDAFAFFDFLVLLIFMPSPLLMLSPLVAEVPAAPALSVAWAKALEDSKATAAVAMISLRMRKTSRG